MTEEPNTIVGPATTAPARDAPIDLSTTNSVFEEPWWLDAVAPGEWSAVTVEDGGRTIARLPYVIRHRRGLTAIVQPPLTQTLGPWVDAGEEPGTRRVSAEMDLVSELVEGLPQAHVHYQQLSPELVNARPFAMHGFAPAARYTYRIEDLSDLDRVWTGFRNEARRDVRKAQKRYQVRDDLPLDVLLEMILETEWLDEVEAARDETLLRRLDAAALAHESRRLLVAVDEDGHPQAALYLVWGERCLYPLIACQRRGARGGGAPSLLLWEAIQHAAGVSRVFDFEGSMVPSIERFFRWFGGRQTQYVAISRSGRWLAPLIAARNSLRRGGARLWALLAAGASSSTCSELLLVITV